MVIPERQLSAELNLEDSDRPVILERTLRCLANRRATYSGYYGDLPAVFKCFSATADARRDFSQELRGLNALRRSGVATPALLYQGKTADGRYCVVTEFLIDSVDFETLLTDSAALSSCDSREAGRALGVALHALHAAGLIQKDAHLGNFLYRERAVWMIDGAGIAPIRPALIRRDRLNNLVLLLAQLPVTAGVFAEALINGYGNGFSARQIQLGVDRQRRRREAKYLRKTLRSCSEFVATRSWLYRRVIRRAPIDDADLGELLNDLDGAISAGESLKQGNSATLAKVRCGGRWLVVKRYNIKSLGHRLRRLFRPTRAARSWQNGYRLKMWGLKTPLPVALVERRFGPLRGGSYLITEYSELDSCEGYRQPAATGEAHQPALSLALSETVAAMNTLGLSHGDLKADNLKFDGQSIQLLDLDSLSRWRSPRQLERATRNDCDRLLRNWHNDCAFTERLSADLENQLAGSSRQTGFISE